MVHSSSFFLAVPRQWARFTYHSFNIHGVFRVLTTANVEKLPYLLGRFLLLEAAESEARPTRLCSDITTQNGAMPVKCSLDVDGRYIRRYGPDVDIMKSVGARNVPLGLCVEADVPEQAKAVLF